MPAGDPRFPGLSVEDQSQASWLADAGRASDAGSSTESFHELPSGSTPRLTVLVELVKADLVRKWSSGQAVSLEFYLEVLPELGTRDTIPAELILAEYEERCRSGAASGAGRVRRPLPPPGREVAAVDRAVARGSVRTADAERSRRRRSPRRSACPPRRACSPWSRSACPSNSAGIGSSRSWARGRWGRSTWPTTRSSIAVWP